MTFLKQDEQFDVIDTLSLHVFQYSSSQREQIRRSLADYVLNPKNSTARAWDTYQLLKQYFPETSRASRVDLMDGFFQRKRPDMAAQVFTHMRQHFTHELRPDADIYIRFFESLGRCPDRDSFDSVHNILKMDATIQPSTRLYNALMIACSACGRSGRALDYWNDISHSLEGPSYASLEIVFAVCEKKPMGDRMARKIWRDMERMEVDVPPAVFDAYVGALAGSGYVKDAEVMIQGMKKSVGYEPSYLT
jgi:hypothetical protein